MVAEYRCYSLAATPTTLADCSLRDQRTVGLLNFGDCDRQEMALLNQRVFVSQSCFLCAQIALKQYHELPNIDFSTPGERKFSGRQDESFQL